jgi:hypothetical protein
MSMPLPAVGRPAHINDATGAHTAAVSRVTDDGQILVTSLKSFAAGPAMLSYLARGGVVQLTGEISEHGTFRPQAWEIVDQRRTAFRVAVSCPALICRTSAAPIQTETVDLSVAGALVAGCDSLTLNERLTVVLTLADEQISVSAHVVRCNDHGLRALEFGVMPNREQQVLGSFLIAKQRETLPRL